MSILTGKTGKDKLKQMDPVCQNKIKDHLSILLIKSQTLLIHMMLKNISEDSGF